MVLTGFAERKESRVGRMAWGLKSPHKRNEETPKRRVERVSNIVI